MAIEEKETKIDKDENLKEKLDRFKLDIRKDADVMDDQREKANIDMRFINVSGGMWEGFLDEQFKDRTKLEFDIVSNYVNRFLGEWNLNRVGVEYKPDDSRTSDDDAELLNGIYRADFRDGSGKLSVDNAVDEVATCGYGCFKLATKFEDEGDPDNERQRIEWRPINNAFNTVFWDVAAKWINKRDARWCTVLTEFTKDSFESVYPDKKPVSAYTPETLMNQGGGSQGTEIIYIATRYEVIKKKETVFVYHNLRTGEVESYSKEDHARIKDELAEDELMVFVRKRKLTIQRVEKSVFNGDEFLEEPKRIAGKWIPIIAVYGYRAFVDGAEWYHGLVRKLIDAARLFNMQVSQLAENSASAGQEVPIFDPDQMPKNIAALWADKNNQPYLLAKSLRDDAGNIVASGPIGYQKPAQLDGSTQSLMQIVPAFVQDTTGGAPQDTLDPNMSGKALNAIRKRENLNTQVVSDNISNAIEWGGEVYQAMASEIYTRSGMVRTISQDGTHGKQDLQKTILDEETGKLVESNSLKDKKFRVYADVGPQYESMREQTVEDLKGMIELLINVPAAQNYIPPILAVLMDNISGVGINALKELNRKQMLTMGLVKPENDEEKQLVAQSQQPQEDPQQKFIEAAANQANAEAEKAQAEGRNLDAKSIDNIASAEKKTAETAKIISETENARVMTRLEIREKIFNRVEALPFPQ